MKINQQYAESIRQPLTANQKDYTGMIKGKLILLYPTTERISGSGVKWVAQCDCGSLSICVPSNRGTNSCGCLHAKSTAAACEARRKVDENHVKAIRESKEKLVVLAMMYGVSHSTISSIKTGRRYAHIQ